MHTIVCSHILAQLTSVRHVVVDGVACVTFTELYTISMTLHRFLDDILQRLILHTKHRRDFSLTYQYATHIHWHTSVLYTIKQEVKVI